MMDVRKGGQGCSREVGATSQIGRAAMVHALDLDRIQNSDRLTNCKDR